MSSSAASKPPRRSNRRLRGATLTSPAVLVALLLAIIAIPPAAAAGAAAPKQEAKVEFERAQVQYRVGHFEDALAGYTRAYELFPAPAFLFNLGQCHKNLRNFERAIFFFEGYLREEADPTRRRLAEELVAESRIELERAAARQEPPTTTALVPPAPSPLGPPPAAGAASPARLPPPAPAVAASAGQANAAFLPDAQTPPERGASRRWWLWSAIGIGALAVAGGLIYWGSGETIREAPAGSLGTIDRR